MRKKWTRWRALSRAERRATISAAALIPLAALSLRLRGSTRTIARFSGGPLRLDADPSTAPDVAARLARAVARASHHGLYAGNCLSRSLALLATLRAHGIVGDLRFGARTEGGKFLAHAWVVHNGRVLNDRQDVETQFAPFRSAQAATDFQ